MSAVPPCRRPDVAIRRERVLVLRRQGYSMQMIANLLGLPNKVMVYNDLVSLKTAGVDTSILPGQTRKTLQFGSPGKRRAPRMSLENPELWTDPVFFAARRRRLARYRKLARLGLPLFDE